MDKCHRATSTSPYACGILDCWYCAYLPRSNDLMEHKCVVVHLKGVNMLALRTMLDFYGIRVTQSFQHERQYYEADKQAGKRLYMALR